jgi:hypothetical protein
MTLTVGGFAPPRSAVLQGKGGTRGRRDNGVSPPPPPSAAPSAAQEAFGAAPATVARVSDHGTVGASSAAAARASENKTVRRSAAATARASRNETLRGSAAAVLGGLEVEQFDVSGAVVAAPASWPRRGVRGRRTLSRGTARALPAALEWRDARLPLLGRLSANAWLPSILLAACLVALVYLVQTSGIATTGYDIQRLQAERDDWELRNEQLQLELAKRQSLTWIESEATGRLGMVRAQPTALTYLKVTR